MSIFAINPHRGLFICLLLLFLFFHHHHVLVHCTSSSSSASSSPAPPPESSDCSHYCPVGLFCDNCPANGDSTFSCHRYQATNLSHFNDGSLPFNRYAWLTTHNAFAIKGTPLHTTEVRVTFNNQEDNITSQLKNGVRGFMLDMYDFLGDIWLCHSFGGICYNYTAFEPAINTLNEMESFLSSNPNEVITIFIEDYVRTPNGLTNLFHAAGLSKYMFPVSNMPKYGEDWPTLATLVSQNYRLLVFTSDKTKEGSEGIAYNWRYVNENQYGNGGLEAGHCFGRSESLPLNTTSRSLVLVNFFPDDPVQEDACEYNSASLEQMLQVCYESAGKRWANYVAVDFYMRSDGGGAFDALDILNARHVCGCSTIDDCKLKLPYGICNASLTATSNPVTNPISIAPDNSRADRKQHQSMSLLKYVLPLFIIFQSRCLQGVAK